MAPAPGSPCRSSPACRNASERCRCSPAAIIAADGPGFDRAEADRLKADEKARFQQLQKQGIWRHIWRVVGGYANLSLFDVQSNDELHELLLTLPFAYR